LKVLYVNSILNSIKKVFVSMLDMVVEFENPIRKDLRNPSYEISSIVKISGEISGCIVLSFSREMAEHVASEMLDEKCSEINDEVVDAINEIANMVTGMADTELEMENVSYSLPKVKAGMTQISYPDRAFVFSMPCVMKAGTFEIDIALYEPHYI
jgi:chemotaxis protein CheX